MAGVAQLVRAPDCGSGGRRFNPGRSPQFYRGIMREINYSVLIDNAMHYIVKQALQVAAKHGLPGNHHFFISFLTDYPGVVLSERIKQRYPHEITVVVQYQYEELVVEDDKFSIVLSFNNIKEKIVVPFVALTAFADPSVKFGLQFRQAEEAIHNNQMEYSVEVADKQPKEEKIEDIKKSDKDNVVNLDVFRSKKKPEDK
jgi:uncharacterized protein